MLLSVVGASGRVDLIFYFIVSFKIQTLNVNYFSCLTPLVYVIVMLIQVYVFPDLVHI